MNQDIYSIQKAIVETLLTYGEKYVTFWNLEYIWLNGQLVVSEGEIIQ